jgi:hypothetical protein
VVTVLLPTFRRGPLLRVALRSIADQTAVGKIDRVIVSENGGDRASEATCESFPRLPITYLYREPMLSAMEHGRALYREFAQGDYTCILHDDDSWLPHHVEAGLAALKANPEAGLYGSNFLCNDDLRLFDGNSDVYAWFGANFPAPEPPLWVMSQVDVLLANVYNMVIHYSTMIARTPALTRAAKIFERQNPYDNDRELLHAFSKQGPVLFHKKFGAAVRVEGERDTGRFAAVEKNRRMCETTKWMAETSGRSWQYIGAHYTQRLTRGCPDEKRKIFLIREAVARPWVLPEIARHLDREKEQRFFQLYDKARLDFAGIAPTPDR